MAAPILRQLSPLLREYVSAPRYAFSAAIGDRNDFSFKRCAGRAGMSSSSFGSNGVTSASFSPESANRASLIPAHGKSGLLVDVMLRGDSLLAGKAFALNLPDHVLSKRQICDVELILSGAFSPLSGFMTQKDYDSVVHTMRLADSTLFPIPVTLDVPEKKVKQRPPHLQLRTVSSS